MITVLVTLVMVLAGAVSVGTGGSGWTAAVFTNTKTVTGNVLTADTLKPATALVVTPASPNLVLTWVVTPSVYADGYKVYRAAALAGPYTVAATVPGRATAAWTDATPAAGVNYYKLAAYRYSWFSAETAVAQGAVVATGPTVIRFTGSGNFTVPAGVTTILVHVAGGADTGWSDDGGYVRGNMVVVPGDILHIALGSTGTYDGGDASLTRNALPQAAWGQGGSGNDQEGYEGTWTWDPAQITGATGGLNDGNNFVELTYTLP